MRIDLVNLPLPVPSHPQRPLRPGKAGTACAVRRRYGAQHFAGHGIDFFDAISGDLKQVPAVKRRSGGRFGIEGAHRPATFGVESGQSVQGRKPDMPSIIGDARHLRNVRKGAIFGKDFGACLFHDFILIARGEKGE